MAKNCSASTLALFAAGALVVILVAYVFGLGAREGMRWEPGMDCSNLSSDVLAGAVKVPSAGDLLVPALPGLLQDCYNKTRLNGQSLCNCANKWCSGCEGSNCKYRGWG